MRPLFSFNYSRKDALNLPWNLTPVRLPTAPTPPEVKSISLKQSCACRDELQRACSQYESDPSAIVRHDPSFSQGVPTSLQNPSGMSYKDNAELYRIQTEETWGHWIWLVAELIPHGRPNITRHQASSS